MIGIRRLCVDHCVHAVKAKTKSSHMDTARLYARELTYISRHSTRMKEFHVSCRLSFKQPEKVPPEQLDQTPGRPRKMKMTREWIGGEFLLHDRGQSIETATHAGHSGGQPDTGPLGQADHRARSVVSTFCKTSRSTRPPRPKVELVGTGPQCIRRQRKI